ncbi:heavy metal-binding domain-containing protein [Nocardioides sp. BGMRC 2183]|nr:heavy metal-binding domain-containing protein [Nocardioides sp. BGMRC 2183]
MKSKDVARAQGLDLPAFDAWLKRSGHPVRSGITGLAIDDNVNVERVVAEFRSHQEAEREQAAVAQSQREAAAAEAERAARAKAQAMAGMLITSGFNFDGYTITKYSGYISGDSAVQVDRPTQGFWSGVKGNVGDDMMLALAQIRRVALAELKEAAYDLGCNAVIGVDFDYLTLDPETVNSNGGTLYLPFLFGVTANGNAVVIERQSVRM